jgi:hypothetical protein
LRLAGREFAAAVEAGQNECGPGGPTLRAGRQKAWLTDDVLAQLHRLLARIERLLARQNQRKEGRLFALTTVLTPVAKRRRF